MADETKTHEEKPDGPSKAHGDAFTGTTGERTPPAQDEAKPGDSPKRHGDPLAKTLRSDTKD